MSADTVAELGNLRRESLPARVPEVDEQQDAQARQRSAEAKRLRPRRAPWRSPLTRRILLVNVLVLVVPILGLLHLDQYRQSLIRSELDAMVTQARTFSLALGSTAIRDGQNGQQVLSHESIRQLMRVLLGGTGVRARVFSRDGQMVGDSFLLSGPGGQVQVIELPPPDQGSPLVRYISEIYDFLFEGLTGRFNAPIYKENPIQRAADYSEVLAALRGDAVGTVWADKDGGLLLSVAVPVQRYRQVLASLMITKDGGDIERAVRDRRHDVLIVFGIALTVTIFMSFYLSRTIASPIRKLAEAAERVRLGNAGNASGNGIPDLHSGNDEISDLASALRDMTSTLQDRLTAIEAFAADVAHEIKNPLSSLRSAVETVARIEDPSQQKKLMAIIVDDVQRLDRLISDISDASRLDAELARSESETVDIGKLLQAMIEVHKAGTGEHGPRFSLLLPDKERLEVNGIELRLGQVFRNLLANAISFSPKDGLIALAARRERDAAGRPWITITVGDEGPGLVEQKLEAIFDRFYTERPEGEKFGTHSGLGLSISRQIVEAHGGEIFARNRDKDGGKTGAIFTVRLPAE